MPKTKDQKIQLRKDLEERIAKSNIVVFVDFSGLQVKPMEQLRKTLRAEEGKFLVAKKTLLELALQKSSKEAADTVREFEGSVGVAFGHGDPLAIAKSVWEFSKKEKELKILGSFFEGQVMDAERTESLAKIPSREQLLGQLVGTMQAPVRGFASVLQGNIKGLLVVLSKRAEAAGS